jgi:FAD-dependent urate hydroxylase
MADLDVCVIGAGPYGLSTAAHLKSAGLGVCVFGKPMEFWAKSMPEGMLLRSPRVASNLSDPAAKWTLDAFELAHSIAPATPLPLDTFVSYGRWFRENLKDSTDDRLVDTVERNGSEFTVRLSDGEVLSAKRVVVAAGIGQFRKIPAELEGLGPKYVSHCYERRDIQGLSKSRVLVVGAGQSALESAALLHEAGASVEVLARQAEVRWIGQHGWLHNLGPISSALYSKHDVGPIGISRLVASPKLVSYFPLSIKDKIRVRAVRPAGARWLPQRLTNVKITTGTSVKSARIVDQELRLQLHDGSERVVDHIILGTGYRVDMSKYEFLSADILKSINQLDGYPSVDSGLMSSVPGLHFVGAPAARTFGPLLYFVAGTEFAAQELTKRMRMDASSFSGPRERASVARNAS